MKQNTIFRAFFLTVALAFGAIAANGQNLSWKPFPVDVGKQVSTILQTKDGKIVTLSEKGLFIITDTNQVERIDNFLPDSVKISCIALDSSGVVYAGTFEDGLYYFDATASNWVYFSEKLANPQIISIAVSGINEIAIATLNSTVQIFRNINNTWINNKLLFRADLKIEVLNYNQDNKLFVSQKSTLYKLMNENMDLDTILPSHGFNAYINSIYFSKNRALLKTSYGIYISNDSCKNWSLLLDDLLGERFIKSFIFAKNNGILMLTGKNGVLYSNEKDLFFEKNNEGLPVKDLFTGITLSDSTILVSTNGFGLYRSSIPDDSLLFHTYFLEKEYYKIKKIHADSIGFIKFSNDGSKIYTTSKSVFRVWDKETGNLTQERHFNADSIFNIQISQDNKEIFVVYKNIHDDPFLRKIEVYDIENDSLLLTHSYNGFNIVCFGLKKFELKKVNMYYDRDSNSLFFASVFNLDCENSSHYGGTFGYFLKTQIKDNIVLKYQFSNAPFTSNQTPTDIFAISDKKLLCLYDIYGFKYDYHGSTNTAGYLSGLTSFNEDFSDIKKIFYEENINGANPTYDPSQSLRYLPNKQIAATLKKSNKMQFWSLSDYKLKTEGKLPFTPIDYHFSLSENRIIAGARNGFFIFSTPSMTAIDSIPFPEADYGWKIAVSPDSVSFAAGNSDGYLVLMKSNRLTGPDEPISVPETEKTNEYEVSPNPASDYINLPKGMPTGKEVSIFSIIGYKAYTGAPNGDRINIGFLPPGIYFLEFGNSRYKFLKI